MAYGGWRFVAVFAPATLIVAGPAWSGDFGVTGAWTGVSSGPKSIYAYAGANVSLGTIKGIDGVLARLEAGSGLYDGEDDPLGVPEYEMAVLAGYRMQFGWNAATFLIGPAYSLHDDDDRGASIRGSEFGVKAEAELYTPVTDAIYISAFANYSTAFDTYHANIRAAYRINEDVAAGPAVSVLGCETYDQVRFGAAAAIDVFNYAELGLTAGYALAEEKDETGLYFGLNVWKSF
ncbi:hypothetical protein BH10PSE7_BH10PSE7_32470 [soil metagenome]